MTARKARVWPVAAVVVGLVGGSLAATAQTSTKGAPAKALGDGAVHPATVSREAAWAGAAARVRLATPTRMGGRDCVPAPCAPGCEVAALGDGSCDAACDVPACRWDEGDCGGAKQTCLELGYAANMPSSIALTSVVAHGGFLYTVGGYVSTDVGTFRRYDPVMNRWTTLMSTIPRRLAGSAVVDGVLYATGGYNGVALSANTRYVLPDGPLWESRADLPSPLLSHAAVALDGQIYVFGGVIAGSATDRMVRYDPATDAWTELAPLPEARRAMQAVAFDCRIFAFGGDRVGEQDEAWVYDPAADTWSDLAPLPAARAFGAAVVISRRIYLLGGTRSGSSLPIDEYDPTTDTWATVGSLPLLRAPAAAAAIDQTAYLIAGNPVDTVTQVSDNFDGDPAFDACDCPELGGEVDPDVYPGAAERCDGKDNDCDGIVDCDDGDACTEDLCFESPFRCTNDVLPGHCAIDGVCYPAGSPHPTAACLECDPNVSATSWSNSPPERLCDDFDACTAVDFCLDGACQPGDPLACPDDGNPCTGEACDSQSGCTVAVRDGEPCETADACYGPGVCDLETCVFTAPMLHSGDPNGDGLLSAEDAQLAFAGALGSETLGPEAACAADCNGDGVLSSGDAQLVWLTVLFGPTLCVDTLPPPIP